MCAVWYEHMELCLCPVLVWCKLDVFWASCPWFVTSCERTTENVLLRCFSFPVLQQPNQADMHINTTSTNNKQQSLQSQAHQTSFNKSFPAVKQPCRRTCSHVNANACKPSPKRQSARSNSSGLNSMCQPGAMSCHFHMPPTSHCHRQNCHDTHTQTHPHTRLHTSI